MFFQLSLFIIVLKKMLVQRPNLRNCKSLERYQVGIWNDPRLGECLPLTLAQPDSTSTEQLIMSSECARPREEAPRLDTEAGTSHFHMVPHQNGSQEIRKSPPVEVSIPCIADSQRRCHKTHRTLRSCTHCPKRRDVGAEARRSSERESISSHDGKSVLKFFHGTFPFLALQLPPP